MNNSYRKSVKESDATVPVGLSPTSLKSTYFFHQCENVEPTTATAASMSIENDVSETDKSDTADWLGQYKTK